jgi:hypothetical protein
MKQNFIIQLIFLFAAGIIPSILNAQQPGCTFKEPLLNIDFGAGENEPRINLSALRKYERVPGICPPDGFFSFASYTTDCFNGDWFTLNSDHTSKGNDGNMMLVNASVTGGTFFYLTVNGVSGNTTYEFAAWMMNVCKIRGGCSPLPPDIQIILVANTGQKVGDFKTGQLPQGPAPHWRRYTGLFTTPANATSLTLIMADNTIGGCGNDFALDDITIRECIKPAVIKTERKPVKPVKQEAVTAKPRPKSIDAKTKPESNAPVIKNVDKNKPVINQPTILQKPIAALIPEPILTRANPVVKQIETMAGDITIDLYDNGIIDGDTVSIYHNNELIMSRAALSDMPITVKVKIDPQHPHHEIVMVAENLGSIPPNTSLMIVTESNKRSEVFISSSKQKNAKVVIDLK